MTTRAGTTGAAAVAASAPATEIDNRVRRSWLLIALLGIGGIAVATALDAIQAGAPLAPARARGGCIGTARRGRLLGARAALRRPGDDADRIFERGATSVDSTGIGLHLARTLARADRGSLRLTEAAPPRFELRLRRCDAPSQHIRVDPRPPQVFTA